MTEDLISSQLLALHEAVRRVENKLDKEVSELKSEQIADLRKANDRLADDQRRVWEAVRAVESYQSQHHGGLRVGQIFLTIFGSLCSGAIVALVVHFAH